jgi:hypothetical protein
MTDQLKERIAAAKMAIETVEMCADRPEARQHAISSCDWLEQIARDIREELSKP